MSPLYFFTLITGYTPIIFFTLITGYTMGIKPKKRSFVDDCTPNKIEDIISIAKYPYREKIEIGMKILIPYTISTTDIYYEKHYINGIHKRMVAGSHSK